MTKTYASIYLWGPKKIAVEYWYSEYLLAHLANDIGCDSLCLGPKTKPPSEIQERTHISIVTSNQKNKIIKLKSKILQTCIYKTLYQ